MKYAAQVYVFVWESVLLCMSMSDVPLTKNYSGDQIEKNEMGGACGTYGGEDRCMQSFYGEIWEKATTWKK